MKLAFQANKTVYQERIEAMARAKSFFDRNNYKIVRTSENSIEVNGVKEELKFTFNFSFYNRIYEGRLSFFESSGQTNVQLFYKESITFEVIQLAIILLASIYIDIRALIFIPFIIGNFFAKILLIKKNFISNVINPS